MEFNSDGSRLFVTHYPYNNNSTLDYWDISGAPAKTELSNDAEIGIGQIEMAKDGKMYIPRQNYLASISNVNSTPTLNLTAQSISNYPLSIGFNQEPLRILQDQLDGSSVYDNVNPSTYHITDLNITTSGVWDGANNPIAPGETEINVLHELRIKAGANVTFKDLTFHFAPGARLIIENDTLGGQGAKLTLDSTTLTNYAVCGEEDMWLGVEVWGNPITTQGSTLNSVQGILQMKNNSKIEHAYIGVLVSRRNESSGVPIHISHNNNFAGGVIKASNSTFFNCQASVAFYGYNQTPVNTSRISSCDFVWDGLFQNTSVKPLVHITFGQNNKVYVGASKFYQNTPSIYTDKLDWGTGILAYNSPFSVASSCSVAMPFGLDCSEANTIRSEFKNLAWGVRVFNFNDDPFEVLRNEFNNCIYGVSSVLAKNQKVSRNNFNIHEDTTLQTWGIYVTRGTGYEITENYLKPFNGNNALTYGVIIDNSGEAHNEVYKNTFDRLYIGTQAQGINGDQYVPGNNDDALGLQYKCNLFKSPITIADIAVAESSRIDYEQGRIGGTSLANTIENAARNSFSHTSGAFDFFLATSSQQVDYIHLADNSQTPLTYTTTSPAAVYPHLQYWNNNPVYISQNACPTKYPSSWWPPIIVFPFGRSAQIDTMQSKIDGGNTALLLDAISVSPKSDSTNHKLMNASPYLSDEVLLAYINSTVSDVRIKNVLIENSKLADTVYNVLKASGRSSALKNDIAVYQTGVSDMEVLIDKINYYQEKLQIEQQAYIHSIIDDTSIVAVNDSLIKYLELCSGLSFQKQLLNVYASTQNEPKFDSLLFDLPVSKYLKKYYHIVFDLNRYNDWYKAVQIDSTIMDRLNDLTTSPDQEAAYNSFALFSVLSNSQNHLVVMSLGSAGKSLMASTQTNEASEKRKQHELVIYPNPTTDKLFIRFADKNENPVTVYIYDLTGKEVSKTQLQNQTNAEINLTNVKTGTYLVKVISNNTTLKTQLLMIQ